MKNNNDSVGLQIFLMVAGIIGAVLIITIQSNLGY